jgi:putative DNA primase/helicase
VRPRAPRRPVPLPVVLDGIPPALCGESRWVLWRYALKCARWTKLPYQFGGSMAKSNAPETWCNFDRAVSALARGCFDGLGFVLGDGWAGVDIDHYVGHTCALVEAIPGYRERSPSGRGLKVIGRGSRVGGQIDFAMEPPAFTTWTGARFFTVTGQSPCGNPKDDLSPFIEAHFTPPACKLLVDYPAAPGTLQGYRLAADLSDDDLLLQMVGSDNGADVLALWRGDTSGYGLDHSRADLALVRHLAFWTNYDFARVDRLFRQSGLMRPKWIAASYRRSTLGKALR